MDEGIESAHFNITQLLAILAFIMIIIPEIYYIMLIILCITVIVLIIYVGGIKKKWLPLIFALLGIFAGIIGGILYTKVGSW
jgi:hypothetical protein